VVKFQVSWGFTEVSAFSKGSWCLHLQCQSSSRRLLGPIYPEDERTTFLRNVGKYLAVETTYNSRRLKWSAFTAVPATWRSSWSTRSPEQAGYIPHIHNLIFMHDIVYFTPSSESVSTMRFSDQNILSFSYIFGIILTGRPFRWALCHINVGFRVRSICMKHSCTVATKPAGLSWYIDVCL